MSARVFAIAGIVCEPVRELPVCYQMLICDKTDATSAKLGELFSLNAFSSSQLLGGDLRWPDAGSDGWRARWPSEWNGPIWDCKHAPDHNRLVLRESCLHVQTHATCRSVKGKYNVLNHLKYVTALCLAPGLLLIVFCLPSGSDRRILY